MVILTESERRRLKFLLLVAATALEEGQDPLSINFLQEHRITFAECAAFREAIAFGTRSWVADAFAEES
jgi:hypothetical protein